MSLQLLMDAHIPYAVTHALRQAGVNVVTAQEAEADELSDEALLDRATELSRVTLTYDDDFLTLANHRQLRANDFTGVIIVRAKKITLRLLLDELILACEVYEPSELENHVLYLPL